MKIEYDPEADGAFVWLVNDIDSQREACVREVWPEEFKGQVGILLDAGGKIMGIELLPASKYLRQDLLK